MAELALTRRFHPRLSIALLSTAILLTASAGEAYANLYWLWPRRSRPARYAFSLAAAIAVATVAAVAAIQGVYALLGTPTRCASAGRSILRAMLSPSPCMWRCWRLW